MCRIVGYIGNKKDRRLYYRNTRNHRHTYVIYDIPLQMLSYYIAVFRSCDVDKPRNLVKSVTVE